ncbi:MAG: hypothetical protein JSS91_13855 [Bacteroidetes bacterium]|nr:hypothetical protein [Bacteroidota bacterium]
MSIRAHLHHLSELIKNYNVLLFLLLIMFGWLMAWISFIVFAIFFAK